MKSMKTLIEGWLSGSTPPPPVAELLHIILRSCGEGVSLMEMRASASHHNPMGTVHGGILCDLADAAMGTALASALAAGETFTTTDLAAHFFTPVREGLLAARGKVVRRGRTTAYVECEISDQEGRLVGKFSSSCLILQLLT